MPPGSGRKRKASPPKRQAAGEAVRKTVAAVRPGRTLTKMEVFRVALRALGQGDEAISTGVRTTLGAELKRLAARKGDGWHRIVSADGGLWAEQPSQQLALLRAEGARPQVGEGVAAWARRVRTPLVGCYKPLRGDRRYARMDEDIAALGKMDALRVEPLNEAELELRLDLSGGKHFRHLAAAKPEAPPFSPCDEGTTKAGSLPSVRARISTAFTPARARQLFARGAVRLRGVVKQAEVAALRAYAVGATFAEVVRLEGEAGFRGRYCFCGQQQPTQLRQLRSALFEALVGRLPRLGERYGRSLGELEERCRKAGQARSANIFLAYGEGALNLAHQDPYGELFFPYQAMLMLSRRGQDFKGGAFFVKNLATKKAEEVRATLGDVTVFAANEKAEGGANFKHGVRKVEAGATGRCERFSVGLVFNLRK